MKCFGNTLIATFTSKLVALASGVPISFWFTEEFITVVSAVIGPIAHGTLFNAVSIITLKVIRSALLIRVQ